MLSYQQRGRRDSLKSETITLNSAMTVVVMNKTWVLWFEQGVQGLGLEYCTALDRDHRKAARRTLSLERLRH